MTSTPNWYQLSDSDYDLPTPPRDIRLQRMPVLSPTELEVLRQLAHITGDGYVISKATRSKLVDMGLVARFNGYNFLTTAGVAALETLGMLKDSGELREEQR